MLSFDPDDAGYLRELAEFVAVPSVSRDASPDTMRAAAHWLAGQLAFAGGRVVETDGHPVVRGEWLRRRRGADRPRLRALRRAAHRRRRRSGALPRSS